MFTIRLTEDINVTGSYYEGENIKKTIPQVTSSFSAGTNFYIEDFGGAITEPKLFTFNKKISYRASDTNEFVLTRDTGNVWFVPTSSAEII